MKKPLLLSVLLCLCIGCVPPQARIPEDEKKPISEIAPPAPTTEAEAGDHVLFYAVHSEGDSQKLVELLEEYPQLRLTLIFPANYFSLEEPPPSLSHFKMLRSSGQIEIALTLDNQPPLPLLADLQLAGKEASAWGIDFSWPADVGGQIAHGSGAYQKRWGSLPAGFYPPYLLLSPAVANMTKQFRFDWVLTKPGVTPGISYMGSTALIVPVQADGADANEIVNAVMSSRVVLVDSAEWETPNREIEFLQALAKKIAANPADSWLTAKEWVGAIKNTDLLPSATPLYERNYSLWTASERQRLAWVALANARKVIDSYQNSGRANLKRLDAALAEMYSAEGGDFLLGLGQSKFISVVAERSFLATLANVYRLSDVPVPSSLNVWFSNAHWKKADTTVAAGSAGPFYVDGPDKMIWNDRAGDDGGEKNVVYPVGKYPAGSFDLRTFSVRWDEDDVQFSATMGGATDPGVHVVLPLVDVYIDVNRLASAGSQEVLPTRRGGAIGREAAWEYALSLSAVGAALYQSVPGGAPRLMQTFTVTTPASGQLQVSVPKQLFRGTPKQWQFTVTLCGTESRKPGELKPVTVMQSAGERNFGGSIDGRPSASYVDLLSDTAADQKPLLTFSGSERFLLPSVEAE